MTAALLCIPFGAAIGMLLGLVGGGGSILAVPVLVYVVGLPVREATTVSLAMVAVTALFAGAASARAGQVRRRPAIVFGIAGATGAVAGAALNRLADPSVILVGFGAVMLVAAFAMLRRAGSTAHSPVEAHGLGRVAPAGIGVGTLSGFFGVGGGFVIVPALVLLLGLDIGAAAGTSLVVIACTSISALATHLSGSTVDWGVAATFTLAGVVGALLASRLRGRVRNERLVRGFAVLVAATAIFLIAKNAGTLA